jgi:hypothetical protein
MCQWARRKELLVALPLFKLGREMEMERARKTEMVETEIAIGR